MSYGGISHWQKVDMLAIALSAVRSEKWGTIGKYSQDCLRKMAEEFIAGKTSSLLPREKEILDEMIEVLDY